MTSQKNLDGKRKISSSPKLSIVLWVMIPWNISVKTEKLQPWIAETMAYPWSGQSYKRKITRRHFLEKPSRNAKPPFRGIRPQGLMTISWALCRALEILEILKFTGHSHKSLDSNKLQPTWKRFKIPPLKQNFSEINSCTLWTLTFEYLNIYPNGEISSEQP